MTFAGSSPSDLSPPELGSIAGLTARSITYRAIDLVLFDLLGTWITSAAAGLVRSHAAAWSQHHAWHAELWASRIPRTPLLTDPDRPTAEELAEQHAALGPLLDPGIHETGADMTPERAEADRVATYAHGVLAGLEEVLTAHHDTIDPVLDAPTARVLDLVLADARRDRTAAAALAATLGRPTGTVADDTVMDAARRRTIAVLR